MARPHRSQKGFTLVELLVTVLVLGVLLALALPAYANSTMTAKQNAGDHNARAASSALKSYAVRNGSFPDAATGLSAAAVVADMGGAIPDNPCSATPGAGGYTYAYGSAMSVSLTAKSDACIGYVPKTFALSL